MLTLWIVLVLMFVFLPSLGVFEVVVPAILLLMRLEPSILDFDLVFANDFWAAARGLAPDKPVLILDLMCEVLSLELTIVTCD